METLVYQPKSRILATRTRGKEAADELRQLAVAHPGCELIVSFQGCELTSPTYLQELTAALEDQFEGRYRFEGMNEDISQSLRFVLGRRK